MNIIGVFVGFSCIPLNAELNPICHLLALLGGATIVVVSRLRVKVAVEQQTVVFCCWCKDRAFGMKLYNDQRNAQVFNLCIYLLLPYMFREFFSQSSGAEVQRRRGSTFHTQ